MNLFFFHLKRFETLLRHQFQHPKMAYLRPQDRHAHRTQGSTHAMSAEDQLIGLSFCAFFRCNQKTAGFTPRNWLVFGMVFFDVSPSFSENEKGVFSGFPGRLFFISYPLDYDPGNLEE